MTGNWFLSGKGIRDIQRTSGNSTQGTYDVYTIFYTDDSASSYSVYNGKDGASPFIGANGNWWVGTVDLGIKASATPDLSAYSTKVQNDGYYLGLNSQSSDSVKLGGHLPSYFQATLGYTPENQSNKVTSFAASTDTQYPSALLVSNQLASKLNTSLKGIPNGLAELGADGFVLNTQLPAYVDKIINVTTYSSLPLTGVSSAIYIADDTNITYRWSGSSYVEISSSLALGETPSTAYRGDRGAVSYAHSQLTTGNPHNVTKANVGLSNVPNLSFSGSNTGDQDLSGLVPKTYTVNGHALSGNVAVTPTDLGLVIGTNVLAYRTFGSAANNNTGDFAPSSNVSFPGFGTTHVLAAYGDHLHAGIYEVPLIFSTGLMRTGNTITNTISQYTDTMADARITSAKITSALGVQIASQIFASPYGTSGTPVFRYLQGVELPSGCNAYLWSGGGIQTANLEITGFGKFGGAVTATGLQVNGNVNITGSLNGTSAAFSSVPTVAGTSLNSLYLSKGNVNTDYWNNGNSIVNTFAGITPDGITTGYNYGTSVKFQDSSNYGILQFWAPETDSGITGNLWYRTGWQNSKRDWVKVLHTGNFTTANYIQNNPTFAQSGSVWLDGQIRAGSATFASTVTASQFNGSGAGLNSIPYSALPYSPVNKAGDVMNGTLNMNNNSLTNAYEIDVSTVATRQIKPISNISADGAYGGIDLYDNGIGYATAAKIFTLKSGSNFYGLTNDYSGSGAQLSIISRQSSGSIQFYVGDSGNKESDRILSLNSNKSATFASTVTASQFNGSGAGLTAVNADTVDSVHMWAGTLAAYNAIGTKSSTTLYIITG